MRDSQKELFSYCTYIAPILEVNQIKQLLGEHEPDIDANGSNDEDWELPNPKYLFPERTRLAEKFYGPEAENHGEGKLLTRRIQVTKDMVALLGLCEPSRRGKRVDWKFDDETDKLPDQSEEPSPSEEDNLDCPIDVCIICYGASRRSSSIPPLHKFASKRLDSLRRHLIESHLLHAIERLGGLP